MENLKTILKEFALSNDNYNAWRKEHAKVFGEIFSCAFAESEECQIRLTSALINISQRDFVSAKAKLGILEGVCKSDYDCAVVNYFIGLNYEFLGEENEMSEYYQKLYVSNVSFVYPTISFHPYYRTAKFAQRDSECGKAIFYYQKALSFYDKIEDLNPKHKSLISQIIYDIATVYLYTHKYDECEKFLNLSKTYDSGDNQQRTYVTAILYAVQGRVDDSRNLLPKMSSFLRVNCEPMINAISTNKELHYAVVKQDNSNYFNFWSGIIAHKSKLEKLICSEKYLDVQKIISDLLSETLSFMKSQISCRIELSKTKITVFCKNYYVKTLVEEYKTLFAAKPKELSNWEFVSVYEFEN